jgi:hypothetical protein
MGRRSQSIRGQSFLLGLSGYFLLASCGGGSSPIVTSGGTTSGGTSAGTSTGTGSGSTTSSTASSTSTSSSTTAGTTTSAGTTTTTSSTSSSSGSTTGSATTGTGSTGGQTTSASSSGNTTSTGSGTSTSGTGTSSSGTTGTVTGTGGTNAGTTATGGGTTGTGGTSTGGTGGVDAGADAGTDAGVDAGIDAGPVADAGCGPSGYGNEFDDCTANGTNDVCACTLVCATDATTTSGTACEQTCMSTSDCSDPATTCVSGFCQLNPCGAFLKDGGGNGSENGACDAVGTGDGTCINNPYHGKGPHFNSTYNFVCVRPGSSSGPCVAPQLVSTDATSCPAGQMCSAPILLHNTANGFLATANAAYKVPMGSYALGACAPMCDLTGLYDAGCPSGEFCLSVGPGASNTGICSSDGGDGCLTALTGAEFGGNAGNSCITNADCACSQSCVSDSVLGQVCEAPCSSNADCPNVGDVCGAVGDGGVCFPRFCGNLVLLDGGTAGPDYFQTCTVNQANDGTCVPTYSDALGNNGVGDIGVCYLGGTATTSCDPTLGNDATQLCPTTQTCFGGQCLTLCDPNPLGTSYPTCPTGVACYQFNSNFLAGVCLGACLPTGANCINSGDCCSGSCAGTCS